MILLTYEVKVKVLFLVENCFYTLDDAPWSKGCTFFCLKKRVAILLVSYDCSICIFVTGACPHIMSSGKVVWGEMVHLFIFFVSNRAKLPPRKNSRISSDLSYSEASNISCWQITQQPMWTLTPTFSFYVLYHNCLSVKGQVHTVALPIMVKVFWSCLKEQSYHSGTMGVSKTNTGLPCMAMF